MFFVIYVLCRWYAFNWKAFFFVYLPASWDLKSEQSFTKAEIEGKNEAGTKSGTEARTEARIIAVTEGQNQNGFTEIYHLTVLFVTE